MAQAVSNVALTDTFNSWVTRTNEVSHIVSNYAVTANSTLGETTGNTRIYGRLSANTLIAEDGIRGGNNTTANTLLFTSNVNVNAHATVANTLTVTGLGTFSAGINAASANITGNINVANTVSINSTMIYIGNSSANASMSPSEIEIGNVSINSTHLVIGATVVNSSTLGESANNATYLAQHTWESPKEIGGVASNSATFTTVVVNKISANGSLGGAGEILKANSTGGNFWSTGGEGYTGSSGTNGALGYSGSRGFTGSQGDTGYYGSKGFTGSVGAGGTPGADGYTGSVGTAGTPGGLGYTGSTALGYSGSTGYTGSSSSALNGYTGSKGFTGSAGSSGSAGTTGFTGSSGGFSGTVTADANFGGSYDIDSVRSLGVGTSGSNSSGEIRATGNITAYYSDDRLKNRIHNIMNALDKVKSLNGFYFEPNNAALLLGYKNERQVGISAQEVQAILPEIVTQAPIDDKYLTVWYDKLIPLLVEAIKELTDKVERLENANS